VYKISLYIQKEMMKKEELSLQMQQANHFETNNTFEYSIAGVRNA